MKVILLQDVAKIGRRFDVVEVPTGHALNMLIPKGLAEAATPENVKKVKAQKDKTAAGRADVETQFDAAVQALEGKAIAVTAPANEQGHLFEALKADVIKKAVAESGVEIDENQIVIMTPIKEVGEHTVSLHEGDKKGTLTLNVTAA